MKREKTVSGTLLSLIGIALAVFLVGGVIGISGMSGGLALVGCTGALWFFFNKVLFVHE